MYKNFKKDILMFHELGSNLELTREFQKFRVQQSDLVLFIVSLFTQKKLNSEQIYYLIFNAFLIDKLLGENDKTFVPIILLNEKLDELFLRYYQGADFFRLSAKHSMNKDLMNVVIFELRDFFKDSSLDNETCLIAVSALESIIDNFYELRKK